jgi:hypothetical protein
MYSKFQSDLLKFENLNQYESCYITREGVDQLQYYSFGRKHDMGCDSPFIWKCTYLSILVTYVYPHYTTTSDAEYRRVLYKIGVSTFCYKLIIDTLDKTITTLYFLNIFFN